MTREKLGKRRKEKKRNNGLLGTHRDFVSDTLGTTRKMSMRKF